MDARHRRIMVLLAALISVTLLAAPARSADFFGIHVGSDGFGVSFSSSDWWVYGQAWNDAGWRSDYDSVLAGYGTWMAVDGLGRCWRPDVAVDWRPFTYGRWVSTPLGWTWVAYEPWGYFPHHYGTWALTAMGWVWVPGYQYHPANVIWVQTSAYIGWYPRGPRGWSHAAHAFARGYRRGYDHGYDDGWGDARYATYVQWRHLGDADLARYAVRRDSLFSGRGRPDLRVSDHAPSRLEIDRRGGTRVPEAHVSRRTVRIGDHTVTAVRPDGLDSTVRRHGPDASRRALTSRAQRRLTGDHEPARRAPVAAPSARHQQRAPDPGGARRSPAAGSTSRRHLSFPSPSGRAEPRRNAGSSHQSPWTSTSRARQETPASSVRQQRSRSSRRVVPRVTARRPTSPAESARRRTDHRPSAPAASPRRAEPRKSSTAAHPSARHSSARSRSAKTHSTRRQSHSERGRGGRHAPRR